MTTSSSKTAPRPWVLNVHDANQVGGCETYRMLLPAQELQKQGKVVDYANASTIRKALARGENYVWEYDIFVFPRTAPIQDLNVDRQRHALILEVDDDFTNQYRPVLPDATWVEKLFAFASSVDAITVSTPYLGRLMHERTGRPVYILPNSVRRADWYVKKRPRLTIGLTGSDTHGNDWRVLETVIPRLLARHDVDFLLGGSIPAYFSDLKERYSDRVLLQPWVPYQDYPSFAGSVQIGLCPVDPTDGFNWSKSGLKAVELMASRAAVVATDLHIYHEVMRHGVHGFLVPHDPESWYGAIERLILDPDLRQRLAANGRQHVGRNYSIERNAPLWWDVYRTVARTKEQSHGRISNDQRYRLESAKREGDGRHRRLLLA